MSSIVVCENHVAMPSAAAVTMDVASRSFTEIEIPARA
jgi:hypothetical protein